MDVNTIILGELRALRDDVAALRASLNDHTIQTASRLARLEQQTYSLLGNGQPGRVGVLEEAIDNLKQWRWRMAGITTAVSTVISVLAWIVKH